MAVNNKHSAAPIRLRHTDKKIDEHKLSAVLSAIYHATSEKGALKKLVAYGGEPCEGAASGDFYWGRRNKDCAAIVVGDASGHNAYAAMLSGVIGLKLDQLWRGLTRGHETKHGMESTPITARRLARHLGERFKGVLEQASDRLAQLADDNPKDGQLRDAIESIKGDGYVGAFCVLAPDGIEFVSMGLPLFVVNAAGKAAMIGAYSDNKQVRAKWRKKDVPQPLQVPEDSRFLVFVTDGITKIGTAKKDPFGEDRIINFLNTLGPKADIDGIVRGLRAVAQKHERRVRPPRRERDDRLVAAIDLKSWRKTLKKKRD
jgi:hypothetical protein